MAREALKNARQEKDIEVKDLANELGISESFYYKIESGVRNPTIELAKRIADILEKTVDELFFANNLDASSKGQVATFETAANQ